MPPTGVDDPYRPPAAAVRDPAPGRRIAWKVYFFLIAASYPLLWLLSGVRWMQPLDAVDLAATSVGLSGLFAYAFRLRLASPGFWKAWLPVQIGWDLLATLWLAPLGLAFRFEEPDPTSALDLALGILFLLPLYVALFRYARRSPEIWQS